jgi:hypothetical protein
LSIHLSISLSTWFSVPSSIHSSIYPSVHLSTQSPIILLLSNYEFVFVSFVCLSVNPFLC